MICGEKFENIEYRCTVLYFRAFISLQNIIHFFITLLFYYLRTYQRRALAKLSQIGKFIYFPRIDTFSYVYIQKE